MRERIELSEKENGIRFRTTRERERKKGGEGRERVM